MSSLVSPTLRDRVRGGVEPIARLFGRVGLTPNALTLVGFAIAIVAAFAAIQQAWIAAGALVWFGAAFDLLDGALARATNTASRFGAFMDSTFDRAGEAVVYIGIAVAALQVMTGNVIVVLAATAMAAAMMVSYARAKAESLGFASGSGLSNVGFAPREVRVVILGAGLILAGLGGGISSFPWPDGSSWLTLSLGLITILATVTTIQRIVHVYLQSKKER